MTLGAIAEIQERLDDIDGWLKHLKAADRRGAGVDRQGAEIEEPERFVQDASGSAAEAMTGKQQTT